MGQWWPAAGLGALSVAVHAWDLLREVAIIVITSTIVWPQQIAGREHKKKKKKNKGGLNHKH